MSICEGDPRADDAGCRVEIHGIGSEGYSQENFGSSEAHKTPVTISVQVAVARQKLFELGATLIKGDYAADC